MRFQSIEDLLACLPAGAPDRDDMLRKLLDGLGPLPDWLAVVGYLGPHLSRTNQRLLAEGLGDRTRRVVAEINAERVTGLATEADVLPVLLEKLGLVVRVAGPGPAT